MSVDINPNFTVVNRHAIAAILIVLILVFAELLVRFKAVTFETPRRKPLILGGSIGLVTCVCLLIWVLNSGEISQSVPFRRRTGGVDRFIALGILFSIGALYLGIRSRLTMARNQTP